MKYDYHVHTSFSFDCNTSIDEVIQKAIALGLKEIAITDHIDYTYPDHSPFGHTGIGTNIEGIQKARDKYKDKISILSGIELSLRPDLNNLATTIIKDNPSLDFIIGSTHDIKGLDFSDPTHYHNIDKKQAYHIYFENMLMVVSQMQTYDVIGHLDYVQRYGTYADKTLHYKDHSDIIDSILKVIIQNGKGIELNTSGYRYNGTAPSPSFDIIRRYKDLGGEIITLGSDAHFAEHLSHNFDKATDIIKNAGFTYITRFKSRKPYFETI